MLDIISPRGCLWAGDGPDGVLGVNWYGDWR
jgi:hypothetical protein